jgi:hypothetical protein
VEEFKYLGTPVDTKSNVLEGIRKIVIATNRSYHGLPRSYHGLPRILKSKYRRSPGYAIVPFLKVLRNPNFA